MSMYKKQSGFTLIETVLYLAIVGILFVAVISFHLILGSNATKLASNIDVSRNRRTALSSIEYLIRNADGLWKDIEGDCSSFGSSTLALYFNSDDYLPTTCVENGGGVKISLDNRRVKLSCHPNITYNGQYQACNVTSSDSFYLTSSDVIVGASDLKFTTSTATSTLNGFMTITTHLKTSVLSSGQVDLQADSEATSTTVLRNEQPDGLVTWWRFDEGTGTTTVDSAGNNPAGCYPEGSEPTWATGIVSSSPYAIDFEYDNDPSTCMSYDPATELTTDPDDLNFDDQFTIATWLKPESLPEGTQIITKVADWTSFHGYAMGIDTGNARAYCRVNDDSSGTLVYSPSSSISPGNVYHISCVYNLDNNRLQIYLYEKGVGLVSSSTYSGDVNILVNDVLEPHISYNATFDGIIDEVRFYNRALSDEEIYALHTQSPY